MTYSGFRDRQCRCSSAKRKRKTSRTNQFGGFRALGHYKTLYYRYRNLFLKQGKKNRKIINNVLCRKCAYELTRFSSNKKYITCRIFIFFYYYIRYLILTRTNYNEYKSFSHLTASVRVYIVNKKEYIYIYI